MNEPLLSLVTGTLNRQESFERLLDSICKHTSVSWELICSNASSTDYTTALPDNITIITERPRLGCSKGYNAAFRLAKGPWVLWLNDDCEVVADYDVAAIEFMEEHPDIGLGALYYSEDGGPFHVNSAWKIPYANFGIFPQWVGTAVGWFDPDLWMYGCDNSFAFRVLAAGCGIAGITNAKIIHHSVKDETRRDNQHYRERDNIILQRKYLSRRREYWQIYLKHFVHNDAAWDHGVQPVR